MKIALGGYVLPSVFITTLLKTLCENGWPNWQPF